MISFFFSIPRYTTIQLYGCFTSLRGWLFSNSPDYNSLKYLIIIDRLKDLDYYLIVIWGLDCSSVHVGALHMRYNSPWLSHVPWLTCIWVKYSCMTNLSYVQLSGLFVTCLNWAMYHYITNLSHILLYGLTCVEAMYHCMTYQWREFMSHVPHD